MDISNCSSRSSFLTASVKCVHFFQKLIVQIIITGCLLVGLSLINIILPISIQYTSPSVCILPYTYVTYTWPIFDLVFVTLLPFAIMVTSNLAAFILLKRRSLQNSTILLNGNNNEDDSIGERSKRNRFLKMTLLLNSAFFISYFPMTVLQILKITRLYGRRNVDPLYAIYDSTRTICLYFRHVYSSLQFVFYVTTSKLYKNALIKIIKVSYFAACFNRIKCCSRQ